MFEHVCYAYSLRDVLSRFFAEYLDLQQFSRVRSCVLSWRDEMHEEIKQAQVEQIRLRKMESKRHTAQTQSADMCQKSHAQGMQRIHVWQMREMYIQQSRALFCWKTNKLEQLSDMEMMLTRSALEGREVSAAT